MSASFVVLAAVRLPRTVAARRALLVAFFLGGLLGLAFLFGGSAHAAEFDGSSDTAAMSGSSGELRQRVDDRMDKQAEKPAERRQAMEGVKDATRDAVEETAEPVAGQAEQATQPLADLAKDTAGASVKLPAGTPDGDRGSDTGSRHHAQAADDNPTAVGAGAADGRVDPATVKALFPQWQQRPGAAEQVRAGDALQDHNPFPAHFPQAPATGGLASQNAGGGNGPRGGDSHAVLDSSAPLFGLMAGAVRAAAAAPTRERSTDILEFPG